MDTDHLSPDHEERLKDFYLRHGGVGLEPSRREVAANGARGWYEVYAADGYALRCDWQRTGDRENMSFSEVAAARTDAL